MFAFDIKDIFVWQFGFVQFNKYKDELDTIERLYLRPEYLRKKSRQLALEWVRNGSIEKSGSNENSNRLREEGNEKFNGKGCERNVLAACRLYTKAIFAAAGENADSKKALALAHANRTVALLQFGFFQEAYDDCVCALLFGYPEHLRHKIIMRLAYCAWKLNDAVKLKQHLNDLKTIELNASFQQQVIKLQSGLDELLSKDNTTTTPSNCNDEDVLMLDNCRIELDTNSGRGRYVMSTRPVTENELVFKERAASFVPISEESICQNCAITMLIPFPCRKCFGNAIYCSLKCRNIHEEIHQYECPGYRHQLFARIGIFHLALRMVIEKLPKVIRCLADKRNANSIWEALNGNSEYDQTFHLMSSLHTMSCHDILLFGFIADFLVLYLKEYTTFFKFVNDTSADIKEWELLTASLILRHVGQLLVNGHVCISIVPLRAATQSAFDFVLMQDKLWTRPFHVRIGCLHHFFSFYHIAVANFPNLSLCNHSCEPTIRAKFSSGCMYLYATKDISADEEIFNCYTDDYRKSLRKDRHKKLLDPYKFICECSKCERDNCDKDYEKFHQYRCENQKCQKLFVPNLSHPEELNWWETKGNETSQLQHITCTVCDMEQKHHWWGHFNELYDSESQCASTRSSLFKCYDDSVSCLFGHNELKLHIGLKLINKCLDAHNAGSVLQNVEYERLVNIAKFCLSGIADQCGRNSIEYVSKMTFLWDLIAIGKYRCSPKEMQTMMNAIFIISDEYKGIFINYYEDYIRDGLQK